MVDVAEMGPTNTRENTHSYPDSGIRHTMGRANRLAVNREDENVRQLSPREFRSVR